MRENEMDHEKHSPTRRAVIGDIAAGLAAGTLAAGTESALAQTERKTFVLVHGSSAGGWCYRRVATSWRNKVTRYSRRHSPASASVRIS